jgi:dihydroflavonol-4-reductase
MKVLVTGATGFLGSHLCRRLGAEGHSITVLRRASSNADALGNLPLRYEIGEITDTECVNRATKGQDVVIHAAACMQRKSNSRDIFYAVNVAGTRNVVQACIQYQVRRLLHVSSVAAIGIPDKPLEPATEDFRFNLDHSGLHYHISKHHAEAAVAEGISQGLDAVIVNPTGLSGPSGRLFRGSETIRNVRAARILRYPSGGVCVVHVEDVVEGLMAALGRGLSGNRYILGAENLSFLQMLERTATTLGLKRIYIPIPAAATKAIAVVAEWWSTVGRDGFSPSYAKYYCASRFSYYDSTKARLTLGFRPRSFDAILEESMQYVNAHG